MNPRRVRQVPPRKVDSPAARLRIDVYSFRNGEAVRLATFELTPADIATLPAAGRDLLWRLLERQACVDGEH